MKTENQKSKDLISNMNLKEIQSEIRNSIFVDRSGFVDYLMGCSFLELIKENANDFTKDIAIRCLDNKFNPSEKQAWCCAYQIKNNKKVYLIAMDEYTKKCEIELNNIKL